MLVKHLNLSFLACNDNSRKLTIIDNITKLSCCPDEIINLSPEITLNPLRVCIEDINNIEVLNTVEFYDSSLMPDTPTSQVLFISNSDIISNKVTLTHQLNTSTLDCSVFDENNIEISVGFKLISSSVVELEMTHVTIPDGFAWKVLLEV